MGEGESNSVCIGGALIERIFSRTTPTSLNEQAQNLLPSARASCIEIKRGLHNRHYVDYGHASALNCGWSAVSNRLGKSNTRPSAGAYLNDGSSIARLVRFGSRLSWQLINQRPHVVCSLHQIELGLQIQPELRIHSEPMP